MSSAVDGLRRAWAARLRVAGFGPVETLAESVCRFDGIRLRIYGAGHPGPLLLIVPAPIKRSYIWDLMPGRSVVRHAVDAGFATGLIEWTAPEREGACRGLDDYAHRLIGLALEAVSAGCGGGRILLAGHSLGGTLAAIFAALQPEKVCGLVLVEAPLHFAPGAGALGSLLRIAPWAPEAVRASDSPVPGAAHHLSAYRRGSGRCARARRCTGRARCSSVPLAAHPALGEMPAMIWQPHR